MNSGEYYYNYYTNQSTSADAEAEAARKKAEEDQRRLDGLRNKVNGYIQSARTFYNDRKAEYDAYQVIIDDLETQKAIVIQARDDVAFMSDMSDSEFWSLNDSFTNYIDWKGSVREAFNLQCCDQLTYLYDTYRANIDSVRAEIQAKIDVVKSQQDEVNSLMDWAYRLIGDYENTVWGLTEWAANSAIDGFESLLNCFG